MPRIISIEQSVAYLRALAETDIAALAAERAGVSRTWAYKRRERDPHFDRLCEAAVARFRDSPEVSDRSTPPLPARAARESPSPAEGRGGCKRVRVNRDRKGGWTAALERRFLAALAATRDVPLALLQVGISAPSAYRRRMRRRLGGSFHPSQPNECFAARWRAALTDDETFADAQWVATVVCLIDGEPVPPELPVQTIGIGDVIRLHERSLGVRRGRPMRP
jgi:hypothetical protein